MADIIDQPDDPNDAAVDQPQQRRLWLLQQALRIAPIESALDLAKQAEAFVLGKASVPIPLDTLLTNTADPAIETNAEPPPPQQHPTSVAPPNALLDRDQKAALQARLDAGATNATVAVEFGLSPRQVQGFRMQIGRRKARSSARPFEEKPEEPASAARPGSVVSGSRADEIVRYLQGQDDVVVAAGPGQFLVNNRFSLNFEQLLDRANRMRQRQGRPEFGVAW